VVTSDLHFLADEFPQRKSADILTVLDKEDGVGSMFERYGHPPTVLDQRSEQNPMALSPGFLLASAL